MRSVVFVILVVATSSCKHGSPSMGVLAFEGEVDMTMSLAPTTGSTTSFEMKGGKVRTETKGVPTIVNITDTEAKKHWTINHATHTYVELDLAKPPPSSPLLVKSTSKARNLGRSDTVAGHSCNLWELTNTLSTTELCINPGLSLAALGSNGPFSTFATSDDAWSEVLLHGFPLRMIMTDASGTQTMRMEVTRIDERSVPDSEFAIPPGYTKTPSPI